MSSSSARNDAKYESDWLSTFVCRDFCFFCSLSRERVMSFSRNRMKWWRVSVEEFKAVGVKPKCRSSVCCFHKMFWRMWRGEVHAIVSPFLFLHTSPPPPTPSSYCLYLFNRALFLQCSHITSMQSPYVLNSHVVDYRRISHEPLSYKQRLCKNDTLTNTLAQTVMAIASDARYCIQL